MAKRCLSDLDRLQQSAKAAQMNYDQMVKKLSSPLKRILLRFFQYQARLDYPELNKYPVQPVDQCRGDELQFPSLTRLVIARQAGLQADRRLELLPCSIPLHRCPKLILFEHQQFHLPTVA